MREIRDASLTCTYRLLLYSLGPPEELGSQRRAVVKERRHLLGRHIVSAALLEVRRDRGAVVVQVFYPLSAQTEACTVPSKDRRRAVYCMGSMNGGGGQMLAVCELHVPSSV